MQYIKLFEAFDKNVNGVIKFLDNLDETDSSRFLGCLEQLSRKYDIGISNIEGKYVKASNAKKLDTQNNCITFWFSLEDGMTIITKNTPCIIKFNNKDTWYDKPEIRNFITNNSVYYEYGFSEKNNWTSIDYYNVVKSDFALIIDIDNCKKGLKELRKKRSEEKLPRIDDNYYRTINKKRWDNKLDRKPKFKFNDKLERLFWELDYRKDYRKKDLLYKILDLFDKGTINDYQLLDIIKNFY